MIGTSSNWDYFSWKFPFAFRLMKIIFSHSKQERSRWKKRIFKMLFVWAFLLNMRKKKNSAKNQFWHKFFPIVQCWCQNLAILTKKFNVQVKSSSFSCCEAPEKINPKKINAVSNDDLKNELLAHGITPSTVCSRNRATLRRHYEEFHGWSRSKIKKNVRKKQSKVQERRKRWK